MTCKNFSTDKLTNKLKEINPSLIGDKSPKIKTAKITEAFTAVTSDIKGKITSAVENFKNFKTGQLPEVKIPNINIDAYLEEIDETVSKTLNKFSSVRELISTEKQQLELNLKNQFDCIDTGKVSSDEVSVSVGDIFNNVKQRVKGITNNQLRDFNQNVNNQLEVVNSITADVVESGKAAAAKGLSDAEKAKTQLKSLDTLDTLVDKNKGNL